MYCRDAPCPAEMLADRLGGDVTHEQGHWCGAPGAENRTRKRAEAMEARRCTLAKMKSRQFSVPWDMLRIAVTLLLNVPPPGLR